MVVNWLEALTSPEEKNHDTGLILLGGITFLLLWAQNSPAFKRKFLKAGLLLCVVVFYFAEA